MSISIWECPAGAGLSTCYERESMLRYLFTKGPSAAPAIETLLASCEMSDATIFAAAVETCAHIAASTWYRFVPLPESVRVEDLGTIIRNGASQEVVEEVMHQFIDRAVAFDRLVGEYSNDSLTEFSVPELVLANEDLRLFVEDGHDQELFVRLPWGKIVASLFRFQERETVRQLRSLLGAVLAEDGVMDDATAARIVKTIVSCVRIRSFTVLSALSAPSPGKWAVNVIVSAAMDSVFSTLVHLVAEMRRRVGGGGGGEAEGTPPSAALLSSTPTPPPPSPRKRGREMTQESIELTQRSS